MNVRARFSFAVASLIALLVATTGCGSFHRSEFLGPEAARKAVRSAAVLPLENLTARPDVGRIVAEHLATELGNGGIKIVNPDAALKKLDLVSGGSVDRLVAMRIGEMLGVDAVVFGSVAEALDGEASIGPRHATVGMTLRVLDVKSGNWLLAGSYSATAGSENGAAAKAATQVAKAVRK